MSEGVEPMSAPISVVNNVSDGRFEASEGGELAFLRYRVEDGTLSLIHTEVPKALEGRGYASAQSASRWESISEPRAANGEARDPLAIGLHRVRRVPQVVGDCVSAGLRA